jgi:serine/threonine-protein kinase
MTGPDPTGDGPLHPLERVIAACERYEADWAAGPRPRIEDLLGECPEPERAEMFLELLALEVEKRAKGGEQPAALDYYERFPGFAREIDLVFADGAVPETFNVAGADDPEKTGPYTHIGLGRAGGRFRVVRRHAQGNLGEVFVARDVELHREVALKEIQTYHADRPESRAQFVLEAEITGRLEHPGVVPVYGMGYHDDGRPFYAMRLIRGETLQAAIARFHADEGPGREPGERVRALRGLLGRFVDVCNAVAYAHGRGILHRDLKPANILLGPYGESLVVDWGLAKPVERPEGMKRPPEGSLRPDSDPEPARTLEGQLKGTPAYMSPEQAEGPPEQLRPSSDVYSLGAILYCLLTGRAPFDGLRRSVLEMVIAGNFPRPRAVNPGVPAALEAVCLKAMALRPADRYATAVALVDDVERWLDDVPVSVYREPVSARAARWARRHKPLVVGGAALLVSAVVGLALYGFAIRKEKARVEAARADAEENLGIARGVLNRMVTQFAGAELAFLPKSDRVRLGMAKEVLDYYRQLLQRRPHDPGARFDAARAYHEAANIQRMTGQVGLPLEIYKTAVDLLEGLVHERPAERSYRYHLAETLLDLGEYFRMTGQPRDAEDRLKTARDLAERLVVEDSGHRDYQRSKAKVLINLAASRLETGKYLDARDTSDQAVALLTALASGAREATVDRLLLVMALTNQGDARRRTSDPGGSDQSLALAVRHATALRTNYDNPVTRFQLASAYVEVGRLLEESTERRSESVNAFTEAYRLLTPLHSSYTQITFYTRKLVATLNGLGGCHLAMGHLDQAEKACRNARELIEKHLAGPRALAEDQSEYGRALGNLGRIARARGKPAEARELLKQAAARFDLARKANPDNPDYRLLAERCHAELSQLTEDPDESPPRP